MGLGVVMSSTLERLKALNDKLESKLSKKSDQTLGDSKKPSPTIEKSSKVEPVEIDETEKTNSTEYVDLAKKIIKRMGIDDVVEPIRAKNIYRIAQLYQTLSIDAKAPDFDNIFIYKAMNISGIGLKEDDFGEIREGKYCQIIAITYEADKNGKKKAKNISLSYFGKAEKLEDSLRNDIMEFVLRWRYEKAFQNLEHYKDLLGRIKPADQLF